MSEAIALQIPDLELDQAGGSIVVYRSRKGSRARAATDGSTKSDKFRRVEIGRGLSRVLADPVSKDRPSSLRPSTQSSRASWAFAVASSKVSPWV
jgi:hypothetical protein